MQSFKFIGLFHTVGGASSFDLNVRGFHRPVTAPRPHFKLLQFSPKIKYFGTLSNDFRKKSTQGYLQTRFQKFDQVVAEMQFLILTGSRIYLIILNQVTYPAMETFRLFFVKYHIRIRNVGYVKQLKGILANVLDL